MTLKLQEWFCMKEGRYSFVPQDPEDAALVFCHEDLIEGEIRSSIEMSFAVNSPIKMLIFGDWGVGKTHLMHHLGWWLRSHMDDFPAHPIMIEIGDVTNKSRFDEVVGPFVDELGIGYLVSLVSEYRGVENDVSRALKELGIAPHIADAFGKFLLTAPGQPPTAAVQDAFEYLKGRKPSPAAVASGLATQLSQSKEFFDVLQSLGLMHSKVHGHRLLFIADEAAKLEAVEGDESTRNHWVNANKLIFDAKNKAFGFIYTISGREKTMPRVVFEEQIKNRLGNNWFELPNLEIRDVEEYLRRTVAEFVDRSTVEALVQAKEISEADYDWETYPFDKEGWSQFVDYFNRSQERAKPRDISMSLDELAFHAGKRGERLIGAKIVGERSF